MENLLELGSTEMFFGYISETVFMESNIILTLTYISFCIWISDQKLPLIIYHFCASIADLVCRSVGCWLINYSEVSISSRSLINIGSWDFLEIIKVEYILRVEIEEMSRLNKSRDYNKCRELEINSIH